MSESGVPFFLSICLWTFNPFILEKSFRNNLSLKIPWIPADIKAIQVSMSSSFLSPERSSVLKFSELDSVIYFLSEFNVRHKLDERFRQIYRLLSSDSSAGLSERKVLSGTFIFDSVLQILQVGIFVCASFFPGACTQRACICFVADFKRQIFLSTMINIWN